MFVAKFWFKAVIVFAILEHQCFNTKFLHHEILDLQAYQARENIINEIIATHNYYRKVIASTGAANMLEMTWDETAAYQAQIYSQQCRFTDHGDGLDRKVPLLNYCGQNIMVASKPVSWPSLIHGWFKEVKYFNYGGPNPDFHSIGHYTQLVWAATYRVGCGSSYCPRGPNGPYYIYICNYCPMGNIGYNIGLPYRAGRPCEDCPYDCVDGLLCRNACPFANFYDCSGIEDPCRDANCNATCHCAASKKIYWTEQQDPIHNFHNYQYK